MKTPNFKTEDQELQHVYNNANALCIGSKFDFVGEEYTVIGFTKSNILTAQNKKFAALDFEAYMQKGFITLI